VRFSSIGISADQYVRRVRIAFATATLTIVYADNYICLPICRTLASAVALPEQDISNQSQEHTAKRRNSSITDNDSKRRRLSADGNVSPHSERQQPSQSPTVERERPRNRRPAQQTGREDERKRGQRLFGGLLGTLSQSSTSAAQKRRADIEKRQQDKLKNQAEEYDGMRSRKKEFREAIRRKETPFYEREAVSFLYLLMRDRVVMANGTEDANSTFEYDCCGALFKDSDRACLGMEPFLYIWYLLVANLKVPSI